MKFKTGAIAVLAVATSVSAPNLLLAQYPQPPEYHDHDHEGWDQPPSEYREIQRQGFHDGIEGARKDFENHRKPTVKNRDEYKHPPVPEPDRDAYRAAFRRGYDQGVEHLMNAHY
jgi:hypothetical protein